MPVPGTGRLGERRGERITRVEGALLADLAGKLAGASGREELKEVRENLANSWMIELARPGVLLDIGANHGTWSVAMARRADAVYAFEPHPGNLMTLMETVSGLPTVRVFPIALSDTDGLASLFVCSMNQGGHSISPVVAELGMWGHAPDQAINVPAYRLDTFCSAYDVRNITGIKIDVEGAELYVLRGARDTLRRNRTTISLETHQAIDRSAVRSAFYDSGYRVYTHAGAPVNTIEYDSQYICTNDTNVIRALEAEAPGS